MDNYGAIVVGSKVRCIHTPAETPEGSFEFTVESFQKGDGVLTNPDILCAVGRSLHSSATINWPVDEITLIEEVAGQ
jgi:hypothetical protein